MYNAERNATRRAAGTMSNSAIRSNDLPEEIGGGK